MFNYLVKEGEFLPAKEIDENGLDALNSEIRRKILKLASKEEKTTKELLKNLEIDKQTLYYNLNKLEKTNLIEVKGGRPKYYKTENAAYYYEPEHVEKEDNPLILQETPKIFEGFIEKRQFTGKVVVGSPYPHGEYERRHRTSYMAGNLCFLIGNYSRSSKNVIITDTKVEDQKSYSEKPLISVSGPKVNTLSKKINHKMPIKFSETLDQILTPQNTYKSSEYGLISKGEINDQPRMMAAGLSGIGTSAAIEALSQRADELSNKGNVVRGYGTKNNIEDVEIVEKI